jgi:hypothetical protein
MRPAVPPTKAAVGFTVKSGWAAAVLVSGTGAALRVADSRIVELSDPGIPETRQPYHAGFGTARKIGPELSRLLNMVRRRGSQSVSAAIAAYRDSGYGLAGAALVVGSTIDPDGIANEHIRIHALEGKLFRSVIEDAVTSSGCGCSVVRQRDLYSLAARSLQRSEPDLQKALVELRPPGRAPWRAEQKAAALAAWLVLSATGGKLT